MSRPRLSVVVPALDERCHLPATLRCLLSQGEDMEVIVVDGGSTDGTWELRGDYPAVRFLRAARGRGSQLNAGAAAAQGDTLLFLHADTRPPAGAPGLIERALAQPGVTAGSFCLSFDDDHPLLRLYALCSRLNHHLFTYGDQGLFLRRATFEAVGGFRPIPLLEDVELQGKVRRLGRFAKLPVPVVTSARRFRSHGVARQQLLNALLVLAFYAGIAPERLACWYGRPCPPRA